MIAKNGRVGVGTPGSVDVRRATVPGARNLSGFDGNVPLAALDVG